MKKLLILTLTLIMCICVLTGCGKDNAPGKTENQDQNTQDTTKSEVSGEIYDAGNVRALVPEGWKAFPQVDPFSDEPDATDPDVIAICKGGETEFDLFSKPYIRIDYYGPDTEMGGGLKDWYSNTEDLDPIQCGPYVWEGFTTTDYGLMAILVAEDGKHQYQASVYLDVEGQTINLDDKDVQAILASVEPSGASVGS